MPQITGIHHVSLTVRDVDASEAFYQDLFGFVRVLDLPDSDGRGLKRVLAHGDTRTILGFTVHQGNDGSDFSEFRTGLDHLAFGVTSRAELDGWVTTLDEKGITHSEITTTPIGDLLTVRDPDNVQIELWANPA